MEINNLTQECWFAARTGRGQELSARERLAKMGITHFVPTRTVTRRCKSGRVKREVSLIPNLIFLKATKQYACSLVNSGQLNVKYVIDRATHTLLRVPDKQMEDFIRVVEQAEDSICPSDYNFVPGGKVKVVQGSFSGVEGEVVKLPNRTYVVVSLGKLVCAKVQIPRAFLKPLEDASSQE